jgi:hypothetical protein
MADQLGLGLAMPPGYMEPDALFEEVGGQLYRRWLVWPTGLGAHRPRLLVVGCNPSKAGMRRAGKVEDDPTTDRLVGFARNHLYGSIELVNLWAFVSTEPIGLWRVKDPVGPHNDRDVLEALGRCDDVLVAWGNLSGPAREERVVRVLGMIRESGRRAYCLGTNSDGSPKHPPLPRRRAALRAVRPQPPERPWLSTDSSCPPTWPSRRRW